MNNVPPVLLLQAGIYVTPSHLVAKPVACHNFDYKSIAYHSW